MNTAQALRRRRYYHTPGRETRRVKNTKKAPHVDVVWILFSVLLAIGIIIVAGVVFAIMHPAASSLTP
jgi:hypothetical protein